MDEIILEMKNISKRYPGVTALNSVNFVLKKGKVTALMGENGAGKSTLMKILAGIIQDYEGDIFLEGSKIKFNNPKSSQVMGISMIHQELSSLLEMTIAENIFLGREFYFKNTKIINYNKMYLETKILLDKIGLHISPRTKMDDLTVSQMQMVEIAKAVSFDSKIIIMDEPTSAITDREVANLFKLIEQFKKEGKSIIYITHKMDEVFKLADEITVFRDGNLIGSYLASNINDYELIKLMVDRDLTEVFPKRNPTYGNVVLEVDKICKKNVFSDISFQVREGEILGIAGLMGAGRTEVVESIFGISPIDKGTIKIDGNITKIKHPNTAIKNKISLVTEDRKLTGLILEMSIKDNMTLPSIKKLSYGGIVIKKTKIKDICSNFKNMLKIKMVDSNQKVSTLSGGNQQKIVLAKWLLKNPKLIIFDEPTRGIDVGAKSEFYNIISDLAKAGTGVIFISSEMPEILGMCDRILVMKDGKITGEVESKDANQEILLQYATGLI